ncbi:hypothetical protein B0I73DRAFT_172733 [Yarrowia lipolytica]|nr:hypothetical protein B0I73DRAFT_172733 [Yarrowia lipolytica]
MYDTVATGAQRTKSVPSIEVTFDVNSNGILNVSAVEKSTGNTQQITVARTRVHFPKSNLSECTRTRMREKVSSNCRQNGHKSFSFSLKNTLREQVQGEADREKLKKAINETIEFLDATQSSASEEYSDKQKELESFSNPILMKFYGVSGGFPVAGEGAAHCGGKCPTVVEVD